MFEAKTGQELTVLGTASTGGVHSAIFSPDGKSILTSFAGGGTGGVLVWNAELATTSLSRLERIAEQRVSGK